MKKAVALLLPLLGLYAVWALALAPAAFYGDEEGYLGIARSLLKLGPAAGQPVSIWFGPGYPTVLMPFVYFHLPLLAARLLNACFLFGAVLYMYQCLALYLPQKKQALWLAALFGLYPPLWREAHLLLTESLVFLLSCGFMYHFCRALATDGRRKLHLVLASLFLACFALTKVFFGYVILAGIVLASADFLWRRGPKARRAAAIFLLAMLWCVPYLAYTYRVSGKVFLWGTSGGMQLYWMTTAYGGELGSYFAVDAVRTDPRLAPHREFFDKIAGLSEVEQDAAFKRQSLANIGRHPQQYLKNWVANVGRLLFSYPFAYTPQKLSTYFYLLPNAFLVVLSVLSVYPAVVGRKAVPYEIAALLVFSVIALGGTSLLTASDRQFRPLVPMIFFWLAYVYVQVLKIELRPLENSIRSAGQE